MRIQALTLLIFATLVSHSSANDKIKRLLADLSFGDVMTADEPSSVSKEAQIAPEPVTPLELESTDSVADFSELPAFSELVATGPDLQLPSEPAPKAVLQKPVPDAVPFADLDLTAVAPGNSPEVVLVQPVETKSVGHRHLNKVCEPRGYGGEVIGAEVMCRPRVAPNLPTSTFLQYFRGNPCDANVWDGYRYACGRNHSLLHSKCDCFKAKNSGTASCDSKKCK
jgi:hypothetical protein